MSARPGLPRVVFAHGKESGPWGSKIAHLAQVAEQAGYVVESLDYQGMDDAGARVERLRAHRPTGAPLVLVGSSMGGYVSAMACEALRPDGLLLLAPALYLPGYPGEPAGCPADIEVIHGWDDDVVPLASSLAFAERQRASLHIVADGHRLADSLDFIAQIFSAQLVRRLAAI